MAQDDGSGLDFLSSMMGPGEFNSLLAQFQPSEADKKQARAAALLAAGAGILGGHGLAQGLSQGLLGIAQYPQQLREQQLIRGQNVQAAMQLMPMLRLAQQQKLLSGTNFGGTSAPMQGPSQPFQAPGGAAALMNAGVAGTQPPTNSLPTQTPGGANTGNPIIDQALNVGVPAATIKLVLASDPNGMATLAKMISDYAKPENLRANGTMVGRDPNTGQPRIYYRAPELAPGQTVDQSGAATDVPGAQKGLFNAAMRPRVAELATTPQEGIQNGIQGIVGSRLDALQGNPLISNFLTNLGQSGGVTGQGGNGGNGGMVAAQTPTNTAPQQRGPLVQTRLTPEQEVHSKDLADFQNNVNTAATAASKQTGTLKEIGNALSVLDANKVKTGPLLPYEAGAAGWLQAMGPVGRYGADLLVNNSAQTLPALKALEKLSTVLTGMQLKEGYGTRESAQIINMVKDSYPNAGQVPGAPRVLLNFMSGINNWMLDTQKNMAIWKAQHGTIDGFPEAWNASHPASSYIPDYENGKGLLESMQADKSQAGPAPSAPHPAQALVDEARKRGLIK